MDKFNEDNHQDEAGLRPPTINEYLYELIHKIGPSRLNPLPMPVGDMIQFWVKLNKPADRTERPKQVSINGNSGKQRWILPYHERLGATLTSFAKLDFNDRQIVMAGILEESVWWNGEPVDVYLKIIDETQELRNIGLKAYLDKNVRKVDSQLNRMTVNKNANRV